MITFESIAKVENIRRKIEHAQAQLDFFANAVGFGVINALGNMLLDHRVPASAVPFMKEALCKSIVAEVLELLSEAEGLGVDATGPKQKVAEFLRMLAPGAKP